MHGLIDRRRKPWARATGWVLALVAVAAFGARAETPRWRPLGPDGGEVWALVADPHQPGVLYAGTAGGGVFKSADGGESWTAASRGIVTARINDLAADPVTPGVLYAATGGGVYKTTDGGASWQADNNGLPADEEAGELVLHPDDPRTLFVTVAMGFTGAWRLLRSSDGGASWQDASAGLHFGPSVAIAPTSPPTLYVGGSIGIYSSTDGGESWTQRRAGLPAGSGVIEILVDPGDPRVLYAALGPSLHGTRPVFKSLDGGASWSPASVGLPGESLSFWRLAADPAAPGTVYAGGYEGLFKTTDGGRRWQGVGDTLVRRVILELLPVPSSLAGGEGTVLYAGVSRRGEGGAVGVLRSTDGGESWQSGLAGLGASFIAGVAPHPQDPGRAVAGAESRGAVRTTDGGATWSSGAGLPTPWVGPLTRHPADPSTLYAVGGDGALFTRVLRSVDDGVTWAPLGEEIGCCLTQVVVDPTDPSTLYLSDRTKVLRSTDGGVTWQDVSGSLCVGVTGLGLLTGTPSRLFAGCARDSGLPVSPPIILTELFATDDGGASWRRVFEGPWISIFGSWSFAFDLARPQVAYAGLAGFEFGSVFWSTDAGETWTPRGLEGVEIQALGVDPFAPGHLWAGTAEDGVFTSSDLGASWRRLSAGLLSAQISALGFGPGGVWAATQGGGVHLLPREELGESCATTATALCLDGRFRVEVSWNDPRVRPGAGSAVPLTTRSGYFWFFGADNLEVAVKLVDGRPVNDHFWLFYGSLSNVGYTLTVTDTASGLLRRYDNPPGRLASAGDTTAFADIGSAARASGSPGAAARAADAPHLDLVGGRFRVEVTWRDFRGRQGTGSGVAVSERSGYLWFFRPESLEVAVKIVDGRPVNGHFWVFIGSLSNVAYEVTVTDLETGKRRTYANRLGEFGSRADTGSF